MHFFPPPTHQLSACVCLWEHLMCSGAVRFHIPLRCAGSGVRGAGLAGCPPLLKQGCDSVRTEKKKKKTHASARKSTLLPDFLFFFFFFFLTCKHVACKYENEWVWELSWHWLPPLSLPLSLSSSLALSLPVSPESSASERSGCKNQSGAMRQAAPQLANHRFEHQKTGRGGSFTCHPLKASPPHMPLLSSPLLHPRSPQRTVAHISALPSAVCAPTNFSLSAAAAAGAVSA